jgi:RimJ/RimL family protein N-acetyltransferase
VVITTERLVLRPWKSGDEDALVAAADHREVWLNLADFFPHPYTRKDAEAWIQRVQEDRTGLPHLAIVSEEGPVGGIGVRRLWDIARFTGDLGYWLAPRVWGRGYATESLLALTDHLWNASDLQRLEARVLEWNPASCRVLEKAGFVREGRLRRAAFKDGSLIDAWLYARVRE